jgi:hypothetical protein
MAQSAKDSWDDLKQLRPAQKIEVVDTTMKTLKGAFVPVSDAAISLDAGKGEESVERQNVLRVSTRGEGHRGRNALIGLAVGAGAGVVVAVVSPELGTGKCAQGSCVDAGTVSMVGFWGGVLGAGLGAAIPTGGRHDVYRAATKPRK